MKFMKLILIFMSLFGLCQLNALTKKDVEDCFAEAKIGYGLYKAFHARLAENPDVEQVRRWVQDENNVRPEWKRDAFLNCLNRKLGGAGAAAIRPDLRRDIPARPAGVAVGVREGGAALVPRAFPEARERALVPFGERRLMPAADEERRLVPFERRALGPVLARERARGVVARMIDDRSLSTDDQSGGTLLADVD